MHAEYIILPACSDVNKNNISLSDEGRVNKLQRFKTEGLFGRDYILIHYRLSP